MEQQDPHDDLSPLADLTSAAHERMSYVRAQGTRRLSHRAVLNRSLSLGRTSFEPVVPSPLGQPSWNQDSVPTPEGSPVEPHGDDDGPRLDEGYDKEPVILHPAGLEESLPRFGPVGMSNRETMRQLSLPALQKGQRLRYSCFQNLQIQTLRIPRFHSSLHGSL
ncbi:hypothetical protein J3458_004351 [Metarhizium acridum]|uniref:uncharacterized protein n=1 Tax=Metarhizium acridum TaxID=92637 RepID=UPI001C6C5A67|nr:hypothetical protein J3458_004351 [Metarhizium acridum]